MGHMTLVAEEIVKLFEHYPKEIYSVVEPHIPQPAWDRYVATTLRETRERDLSPLGGGISLVPPDAASITSGLSDEDDEFPLNTARAMRALEAGGQAGEGQPMNEGALGGHVKASNADAGEAGSSDEVRIGSFSHLNRSPLTKTTVSTVRIQFSRYLATAISNDRSDKFGSSDEDDDEDDAGWLGGSRFDPGDVDFVLAEGNGPKAFGFDDRFDGTAGKHVFTSSTDSDDVRSFLAAAAVASKLMHHARFTGSRLGSLQRRLLELSKSQPIRGRRLPPHSRVFRRRGHL